MHIDALDCCSITVNNLHGPKVALRFTQSTCVSTNSLPLDCTTCKILEQFFNHFLFSGHDLATSIFVSYLHVKPNGKVLTYCKKFIFIFFTDVIFMYSCTIYSLCPSFVSNLSITYLTNILYKLNFTEWYVSNFQGSMLCFWVLFFSLLSHFYQDLYWKIGIELYVLLKSIVYRCWSL